MRQFRILFFINTIIVGSLTVAIVIITSQIIEQQRQVALQNGSQTAHRYAQEIFVFLEHTRTTAENFAVFMSNYSSGNREEVSQVLEQFLRTNPHFLGTYVGYEPQAFDGQDEKFVDKTGHDSTGRFIPYWNRLGDKRVKLAPLVNYDTSDWYLIPKNKLSFHIFDPFVYEGTLMTSFIWPIIKEDQFLGVTGIDISLETMNTIVKDAKIFDTGYAFLVGRNGSFITHPNDELISKNKTIQEYSKETNVPELQEIADKIKAKQSGYVEILDPLNNKPAFMFYEPIKIGEWSVIITIPRDELLISTDDLIQDMVVVFLITLIFIAIVTYLVTLRSGKSVQHIIMTMGNLAKGDLKEKAVISGNDEISKLGFSINQFIEYLYDFVQKIQVTCLELQSLVEKVHTEGENLSQRALKEKESINSFKQNISVTTAMIDETAHTTVRVENQVQKIKSAMNDIQETSNKMAEVLKIIDDITFETNLLAINASVEAAHVGDVGKGFEVVADEIRLLSKRTEIQSREVNSSVNENIQKIGDNVRAITSVTESISEITIASEEQANAMKEISNSISEIDAFTQQSVNLVNEIKGTSSKINTYTQDLLTLVQFFQLKN